MHSTLDRAWFVLGAVLALFVVLGPGRFIRIFSYSRARISDIPPGLMKALRVIAAVVVISALIALGWDAWSAS